MTSVLKEKAILIDFDGTICDAKARRHYVEGETSNYNKFYEALSFCLPQQWCVEIINRFKSDHKIILVTGQPNNFSTRITDWMNKYSIHFDEIFCRATGDQRKDSVIKKEIYEAQIKNRFDVLFCVDDRKLVVDMWRSQGLTVLQCDEGDF